jgi:hypothetical protein
VAEEQLLVRAIALVLLCGVAQADTYRFADGVTLADHEHRCSGGKSINNWTEESLVTTGSDATLQLGSATYHADGVAGSWMVFHTKDTHTVVVRIDPIDCVDLRCSKGVHALYHVIRHKPGEALGWGSDYCYERWVGVAKLVNN